MCTAIQKSVVMYQGGPWISSLSLWMKVMVIHRLDYAQFSGLVINWAKGWLCTGLNPQKDCVIARKNTRESRRGQSFLFGREEGWGV
jgi:hypothetical protein